MSLRDHRQKYVDAIRAARMAGDDVFHSWFNQEASQTREQVRIRGFWDMTMHILTPTVCAHIERPEEKVALEIGYGGGRLMNAACCYFREVIGIDIHEEQEAVNAFLRAEGKSNFRLLSTASNQIEVDAESIDFIFSFIVFQHLPSFEVFTNYLREIHRSLKHGCVAQIFFGCYGRLHPLYQIRYFLQGYREVANKPANHISLVIRRAKVQQVCRTIGLSVLEMGTSFYRVPDGYPANRGGQTYVTLLKPSSGS